MIISHVRANKEKGEKRKATVMLWGTMRLLMGSNITEDVVMWLS